METRPEAKLKRIPLGDIREGSISFRKVNKKDPKYLQLVDSVRQDGILNAVSVREGDTDENGKKVYNLIDGLNRFNAARDAGLDVIPAQVFTMNQTQVMKAQLIANVHKIEPKAAQYSEQLIRILNAEPTMTIEDLAKDLSRSVSWLKERLKLVNLPEHVQKMVDDKVIGLTNAYTLADLHELAPDEVNNFLDRAQTEPPDQFAPAIQNRVKAIRDARKAGKKENPEDANKYTPYPHARKPVEIKAEFNSPTVGEKVCQAMKVATPVDGFAAGIAWVLRMDPVSIEEDTKAFDSKRQAEKDEREARKKEKERIAAEAASRNTEEALTTK